MHQHGAIVPMGAPYTARCPRGPWLDYQRIRGKHIVILAMGTLRVWCQLLLLCNINAACYCYYQDGPRARTMKNESSNATSIQINEPSKKKKTNKNESSKGFLLA
jgi:hypothetical protein